MKSDKCVICGENKLAHHQFTSVSKPRSCVCGAAMWGIRIPPACKKYVPCSDKFEDARCDACEHDKGCHK